MLKNFKYTIYQFAGLVFPSYFKSLAFSSLKGKLDKKSLTLPPERELLILHHFIDPKLAVIDVGANNGLYCYYFQEICLCKEIYAFEPIPKLFKKLKKWFNNITFYQYAVSNRSEKTTLKIPYINSFIFETRAKLDNFIEEGENKFKEISINTITLDTIFLNFKSKIGFLKIDIEGHELQAILGAKEMLKKHLPIMMVEIEKRHHGDNFEAVIESINLIGYNCYFFKLEEKKLLPFSQFSVNIDQNLSNKFYINNFFFFPVNFESIDQINIKINNSL